jgi:hypothetical protein
MSMEYNNVKVDDIRGASLLFLQAAQAELANLIAEISAERVNFIAAQRALEDFNALRECGETALHRYAGIAECVGSG